MTVLCQNSGHQLIRQPDEPEQIRVAPVCRQAGRNHRSACLSLRERCKARASPKLMGRLHFGNLITSSEALAEERGELQQTFGSIEGRVDHGLGLLAAVGGARRIASIRTRDLVRNSGHDTTVCGKVKRKLLRAKYLWRNNLRQCGEELLAKHCS